MQKILNTKMVVVILVTILCLYLIYPTVQYFSFVSSMDDPPTEEQRAQRAELLNHPRVIGLGLDLQGGVDFLLEVDSSALIRRNVENEQQRLRNAFAEYDIAASVRLNLDEAQDPYVEVGLERPEDLDYALEQIQDLISGEFSLRPEGNIREQLQNNQLILRPDAREQLQRIRQATDGAFTVVKKRVDEFGLTQPIVARAGADRISVKVPGEDDPDKVRETLLRTASLEFRLLHPEHDSQIQQFIKGGYVDGAGTGRIKDEFVTIEQLPDGRQKKTLKRNIAGVPAGYTLRLGVHKEIDEATGMVNDAGRIDDLVYLVRNFTPLTGDNLRRATVYTDLQEITDPIKVSLEFDGEGADAFCRITEDNVGRRFAIILDDQVFSAPTIQDAICGGRAQISGGFSRGEATDLATTLRAGALPAKLNVITQNSVGPSLGAESIRDSVKALAIGGLLIIIMMGLIYMTSGVVAVLAMLLNVLLIMAVFSLMGATLTLSGIGGILLTMGMAVDANILIYERLREELDSGKPLRAAINAAFGRAFSVIMDSNITTMLPALVLVLFEVVSGSVKGFWTAIAIGLGANLYTAIVVTRALMEAYYAKFKTISVGKIRFLQNASVDWMKYRVVGLAFSGSLVAASIGYLAIKGPSYGIDFTGGVQSVIEFSEGADPNQLEIAELLEGSFSDTKVIKIFNPGANQWQLTVPQVPMKGAGEEIPTPAQLQAEVENLLAEGFSGAATVVSSTSIEAAVGGEFKWTAIMTILVACAVILSYLAFRFQWIFGIGALLALFHDVFLSFGIFKMLGHTLTLDIVSALLIILGYSVNDTIVVFDRIRERMQDRMTAKLSDVINVGINETLSRTILTSGTTLAVLAVMYFFGGAGLNEFALILLLGVGLGTYSSIFIASACVYTYLLKTGKTTVIQAKKATTRVAMPKQVQQEKQKN